MLDKLIDAWIADPEGSAKQDLYAFMDTPEYYNLPYMERNARFITSSKLKLFEQCELFAKYKYEDRIETGFEGSDALTIGSALDTLLTYGPEVYAKTFVAMGTRVEDVEAEIDEQRVKIQLAKENLNKDGSRSKTGIKSELAATEKIKFLESIVGKTQLTMSQQELIDQMKEETKLHPLFPKEWKKRNIVWLAYGKYPCKAELDHFDNKIVDLKTCADITSFKAMQYLPQQGFYFMGCLEEDMMKYEGELHVVDKNKWSRSHVWRFGIKTLESATYTINKQILAYAEARESGMWRGPDPDTQEGLELLWRSEFWKHCPLSRTSPPTEL